MIVYKNGAAAREAVRDMAAAADPAGGAGAGGWEAFEAALEATPPGNGGRLALRVCRPLGPRAAVMRECSIWPGKSVGTSGSVSARYQ